MDGMDGAYLSITCTMIVWIIVFIRMSRAWEIPQVAQHFYVAHSH